MLRCFGASVVWCFGASVLRRCGGSVGLWFGGSVVWRLRRLRWFGGSVLWWCRWLGGRGASVLQGFGDLAVRLFSGSLGRSPRKNCKNDLDDQT